MAILLTLHLIITLAMIGIILLQKNEGGSGLLGGGGNSNSMFTARGAANLLTRVTAVLAALFIGNCILMTYINNNTVKSASTLLDQPASKS